MVIIFAGVGIMKITGFAREDGSAQICLDCNRIPDGIQRTKYLGEHGTFNLPCMSCGRSIKRVFITLDSYYKRLEREQIYGT